MQSRSRHARDSHAGIFTSHAEYDYKHRRKFQTNALTSVVNLAHFLLLNLAKFYPFIKIYPAFAKCIRFMFTFRVVAYLEMLTYAPLWLFAQKSLNTSGRYPFRRSAHHLSQIYMYTHVRQSRVYYIASSLATNARHARWWLITEQVKAIFGKPIYRPRWQQLRSDEIHPRSLPTGYRLLRQIKAVTR